MDIHQLLSDADRELVRNAVREAEAGTSGEIVPYVVPASDAYAGAVWKGAALGAILGPLVALAVYRLGGFWATHLSLWMALPAPAGAAAGCLLTTFLPPVRRWLAGPDALAARVHQRAAAAFLEQEVFRTRERTGILIFLSLFERRVVVLGDSGIHARVEPACWDGVVATVVSGLRGGGPAAALAAGIRQCGELLARCGVARRPDDANELADELREGEP